MEGCTSWFCRGTVACRPAPPSSSLFGLGTCPRIALNSVSSYPCLGYQCPLKTEAESNQTCSSLYLEFLNIVTSNSHYEPPIILSWAASPRRRQPRSQTPRHACPLRGVRGTIYSSCMANRPLKHFAADHQLVIDILFFGLRNLN